MPQNIKNWYEMKQFDLVSENDLSMPIERLVAINPQVVEWFNERGIDLHSEPVEIRHAAQHFQGGILINTSAETGVPGLYACGEAAGGQHGADRPGGNSLMDCQVMGHIAGIEASKLAGKLKSNQLNDITDDEIPKVTKQLDDTNSIRETLSKNVGVIRTSESLKEAADTLSDLSNVDSKTIESNKLTALSTEAMIFISKAIALSALSRKESRGSHLLFEDMTEYRLIPTNEPEGRFWNVVTWTGNDILHTKSDIPVRLNLSKEPE